LLRPHLEEVLAPVGGFSRLAPLERGEGACGEAEERLVALDRGGTGRALVRCARPQSERLDREVLRSLQAKVRLGPSLGVVVLEPLLLLRSEACIFAVHPLCRPWREPGLPALWGRLRGVPGLLDWLRQVTLGTAREPRPAEREAEFARPLRWFASRREHPLALRERALLAWERLERGDWRPRQVLAHNDLRRENLFLPPGDAWWLPRGRGELPLLGGWAESRPRGHPLFDLLRLAESLRLPARRLEGELSAHLGLLGCEPLDAWSYTLAALGARGSSSELPPQRYARLLRVLAQRLASAGL